MAAKRTSHHTSPIIHGRFGNLTNPRAVVMPEADGRYAFPEANPLTIHLSVTGKCFARCKGCINSALAPCADGERGNVSAIGETVPERDARCIIRLMAGQEDRNAVVCFYGGEPLLAMDKIDEVARILRSETDMRRVHFMLYTNGELLDRFAEQYPRLAEGIWLYSVSIDGTRGQHERVRIGTHLERIHHNLEKLKKIRAGKVLMWSTLREDQSLLDCFTEFIRLRDKGLADIFFWHWLETPDPLRDLARFAASYEEDLTTIMDRWVRELKEGNILAVAHMAELVLYLLSGKDRGSTACGVELEDNYDIMDGKIHACVDLPSHMAIGEIEADGSPRFTPHDLRGLVTYKRELGCHDCGVHPYCGGRCPVQAHCSGPERLRQYCQLMRLHVGVVSSFLDEIKEALAGGGVSPADLYWNSAYFALFTDVTP